MARKSLRRQLEELIDSVEPRMKEAFLASINEIRSNVTVRAMVDALRRSDIEAAIAALNIEGAAFLAYERALRASFEDGGTITSAAVPWRDRSGARVNIRFDSRNVAAEQWVNRHAGEFITRTTDDMRQAVRQTLQTAISRGDGPLASALEVTGRINRASGRREGGVLGLSGPQERYVANAKEELLSGDAEQLRHYLTRERRDKRYDKRVQAALDGKQSLTRVDIDQMVDRYSDRLLDLRGEMVARTETMEAVHSSKYQSLAQGLEKTGQSESSITRIWRSASDRLVRDSHAAMNGQKVVGLRTPFVSPSGARMLHPGDRSLGAGVGEIIGCRCDDDILFDFSEGLE